MFEKVNPCHPDKLADRIAGAIVDLAYARSTDPRVAVEVLIGHGKCHIITETSEHFKNEEIEAIVERISGRKLKIDYAEYMQDKHLSDNQVGTIRCGDNGIFRGVPLTAEQKELAAIARNIYAHFQKDGKYVLDHQTGRLVICQSNAGEDEIRAFLPDLSPDLKVEINPLGYWTGGIDVDSGATNRKLGSDMGDSMTGGGLWGKDLSKADISLNLYAWKNAQKLNEKVEIVCAIGDEEVTVCCGNTKTVKKYKDIIAEVSDDILNVYGGFEKFAEWGYF
ncbi:MAG: S-adenosylmethionine synthetase [Erysipelotrichaceae bacterium]|nr:S-adenosylmethionine synthetase [Erysipelotrichaceae bacterium]